MKKVLSILIMAILVLAGCSSASASSSGEKPVEITEDVTITFWHAMTGVLEETLITLTDEYNNSQEYVTVELVNQGDYETLQQKITQAGDAGELPTMAQGYSYWMIDYIKAGWLVNLNPYFEDETYGIDPNLYVDAFIEEVTFEGNIYAVPFNKSTEVIYYNKTLFEEAGITTMPATYDELLETAKIIYEETGVVGAGYDQPTDFLAMAIHACGIDAWFNEDGTAAFNDTCVVEQVDKYQTGIEEGYMRVAGEEQYLSGPFGSGVVAMNVASTGAATFMEASVDGKFEMGVAPYPGKSAPQKETSLMIFSSATAQEASAAWDYIKFLTNDKNTTTWAIQTGYLPVTYAAYETPEYQAHMEENEVAKVAASQIDKMEVVVPVFPGANEVYKTLFADYMSAVLEAGADPQAEMDKLQVNAEEVYARNN